jgi:hypothetical protein
VQTLAEISEQCEALHARHATLRAQRQQLSSGIIASMKNEKFGPDHGDMLLNEQLSLAAVGSSIDICFAKLKSLECRREDAIATLIAQASAARRVPPDSRAVISRKSSLAPSLDSVSRLATGRSTPDLHSLYNTSRPGLSKSYSYRSEWENQRIVPTSHPRESSLFNATCTDIEYNNENLAASIRTAKRLTQIPEPPITPESSYQTADETSTADEADDSQTSESSDNEGVLPKGLLRKSQTTGAKANSAKAVKVLGIGLEDAPVSPLSVRVDAMKKKARVPPLKIRLNDEKKAETDDVSPLTSSTMNAEDSDQLARDLELQLQSFPSAPVRDAPPPPTGDVATRKPRKIRRHDSPVQRSDTAKSHASAHTINVYYDPGHNEDLPLPFP